MQAPGQVQRSSGEGSEGSREGLGGFGAEPGQVQQGFGPREGRGDFGAKPGQVQQGSGTGSGEGLGRLWCRARSSLTGFRRRLRRRSEALVQSRQVQLGAEPGQIQQDSGEGSGEGCGEALVQSQVRFNRFPEKVPVKVGEALVQSQVRFSRVPEKFLALGFAARFRRICKNKTLRLLGIPPKLIFFNFFWDYYLLTI